MCAPSALAFLSSARGVFVSMCGFSIARKVRRAMLYEMTGIVREIDEVRTYGAKNFEKRVFVVERVNDALKQDPLDQTPPVAPEDVSQDMGCPVEDDLPL